MSKRKVKDQTERCYSWEGEWAHWSFPDLAGSKRELRKWAKWAAEQYGLPAPKVRVKKLAEGDCAQYEPTACRITVDPSMLNIATILHESAHYIAHSAGLGEDSHAHGPKYLGVYIHLMAEAHVAPKDALLVSAKNRGLVVSKRATPSALCNRNKSEIKEKGQKQ